MKTKEILQKTLAGVVGTLIWGGVSYFAIPSEIKNSNLYNPSYVCGESDYKKGIYADTKGASQMLLEVNDNNQTTVEWIGYGKGLESIFIQSSKGDLNGTRDKDGNWSSILSNGKFSHTGKGLIEEKKKLEQTYQNIVLTGLNSDVCNYITNTNIKIQIKGITSEI